MKSYYQPSTDILTGIQGMFPLEIAPWDEYFMAMAQTDFKEGRAGVYATKSYFIRKAPFGGSFALLGGLHAFLETICEFRFSHPAVQAALLDQGYHLDFLEYLKENPALNLKVYSALEGSVFLPNEPIVTVAGDLISVRIAEGILTRAMKFTTLTMKKWNRICSSESPRPLQNNALRLLRGSAHHKQHRDTSLFRYSITRYHGT